MRTWYSSGLYAPGNFGFGAGVTPDPGFYLSTGGRGAALRSRVRSPLGSSTKILGGNLGLSLGSADNFAWAHGVLTGLINAEETVQGWGFGDTTARAQLGWTSGALSNTLYLTTWFPTGRYQRGFNPNTGKNHYGVNLGWGVTYTRGSHQARVRFCNRRYLQRRKSGDRLQNGDDLIWEWAVGKKFAKTIVKF